MKYKDRNAKDSKILVGISNLSLAKRFERIKKLELALKDAEVELSKSKDNTRLSKKQGTQLVADEDMA